MSDSIVVRGAERLVVALDDGYAAYDQEQALLAQVGARFDLRPCRRNETQALAAVRDADVVLVRESPVSRRVIDAMGPCKAIIRYGIGVDNIDQTAASERRIMVANVPDYGTDEVSSHAVALTLAVSRRLWLHDREVREGRWSTGVLQPMFRLRGRTLGLVGFGRIAQMTLEKLAGFGFARVLVHDPRAELPAGVERAARACSTISARRLLAPITLVGRTALSVEISTKVATPAFTAARAARRVPKALFMMPSKGFHSTSGTCL